MDTETQIQILYFVSAVIAGAVLTWVTYMIIKAWLEKRKTDIALRISEAKYRAYLENAPIGVLVIDKDGMIQVANETFGWIAGIDRNDLIGNNLDDMIGDEINDQIVDKITSKTAATFDMNFYEESHKFRAWSVNSILIRDPEYLVFVDDITDRVLLEERVRQASKMEAIGQLASGVAHEFNNILQAVKGYSDSLIDMVEQDSKEYDYAVEINAAGERASAITKQLLTFSYQQKTNPEVLKINNVVSDIFKMLNRTIGDDIEIDLRLGRNLPNVFIDPNQLEIIVMNLCINARDAMPNGGTITVQTFKDYLEEPITGFSAKPGEYVILTIEDTGIGMEEEIRERIFEPFFTTKERGRGTGLGLATVYGSVKSSNGVIAVESEPGEGTLFKILLPAHISEESKDSDEPETDVQIIGGTETIILAEDDPSLLKLAIEHLETSGYTVLAAPNGDIAVDTTLSNLDQIDIAVFDYVMPGKNGYQAYKAIAEVKPELPVLFISGSSEKETDLEILQRENLRIIRKPYSKTELLKAIREILDS